MSTHALFVFRLRIRVGLVAAFAAVLGIASPAVLAASVSYTGKLLEIWVNNGVSMLEDAVVGQEFSGSFQYGDTLATVATSTVDLGAGIATYEFNDPAYFASLSSGSISVITPKLGIEIRNGVPLTAREAYLAAIISQGPVVAGTPADVWSAYALEATTYLYDATPLDGIDNPILIDGGMVTLSIFSLDTNTISGLAFAALPPALGPSVHGLFVINQSDAQGNVLFSGLGELTSLTAVPLPGSALLLLVPAGLLLHTRRHRVI